MYKPLLISKAEPSHLLKEPNFIYSYPRSHSFDHDPHFHDHRCDLEWRWKSELKTSHLLAQLPLHHNRSVQRPFYWWWSHNLLIHLLLQLAIAREQDHEILKLLCLGLNHPRPRGSIPDLFELRTILLKFGGGWLAARLRTVHWRSWHQAANRATSSTKSGDATLMLPNQMPRFPRLHLEILSMNATNRRVTWWSSAQLLLWLYRDWITKYLLLQSFLS